MGEHLDTLLHPESIAVIGASADRSKWGNRLVRNTIGLGYTGRIWAVNPRRVVRIDGSAYAESLTEIGTDIDLAVATVPHTATLAVVRECAAHGVRNLVLPASGFGETGAAGADQEREISKVAREAGMRILGPNCFGLFSSVSAFNTTPFTPIPEGDVALVSQSGNVAGHAFFAARRRAMGFSHVVGLGNQLDISFADLVAWLAQDQDTTRIALYLEGLRDTDAGPFLDAVARCRDAGKPVVVVKAGGSEAGRAVALSHTGSLATEDHVWDEALAGAGAIRVHSVADLFGVLALSALSRPQRRRLGVLTDGGGDSIMAVDGVERHDLQLASFPSPVQDRLDAVMPPAAPRIAGRNPITLDTAGGVEDDPEILPRALAVLEDVPGIDVVVVGGLYGTYEHVRTAELRAADGILACAQRGMRVVVHSPIEVEHSTPLQLLQSSGIPVFDDMDALLHSLSLWLPAAQLEAPDPGESRTLEPESGASRQWATEDAHAMLSAAGVLLPRQVVVANEAELVQAAAQIDFPVCLKTADPAIVHKSDVGGVRVGITDAARLKQAAAQMTTDIGSARMLVMPSLDTGTEILMGARCSQQFGPVLVAGRGGIWTEVEADTRTFIGDVTAREFVAAMRELRCAPMLFGGRGQPPLDVEALVPLAKALLDAVRDHPDVSIELNPVFLYEDGYGVADLRVVEGC
jgi:acyl-CoA synthetase (NDP forming)